MARLVLEHPKHVEIADRPGFKHGRPTVRCRVEVQDDDGLVHRYEVIGSIRVTQFRRDDSS